MLMNLFSGLVLCRLVWGTHFYGCTKESSYHLWTLFQKKMNKCVTLYSLLLGLINVRSVITIYIVLYSAAKYQLYVAVFKQCFCCVPRGCGGG